MKNRQIDKNITKQVRINADLLCELKIKAAQEKISMVDVINELVLEYLLRE